MKIKELECHCMECLEEIYLLCEKYCNYQDDKTALCEQPRFLDMDINDYENVKEILMEDEY